MSASVSATPFAGTPITIHSPHRIRDFRKWVNSPAVPLHLEVLEEMIGLGIGIGFISKRVCELSKVA